MKFARWVFNIASVYGVISVAPLYFMERTINQQNPPSITHPMFFYGFTGVTLAWQLLFFAIARQPMRLRPVIPFAVLEKLSFGLAAMVLYRQARLDHNDLWFASSTRPTPQHLRVPSLALFASAVFFQSLQAVFFSSAAGHWFNCNSAPFSVGTLPESDCFGEARPLQIEPAMKRPMASTAAAITSSNVTRVLRFIVCRLLCLR